MENQYIDEFDETLKKFIIKVQNNENSDSEREKLKGLIVILWLFFRKTLAIEYDIQIENDTEEISDFLNQFDITLDNLKSRIQNSDNFDNEWQGNRISKTDIAVLYQLSKISIANQLIKDEGYVATKTWIAKMDSKTCNICKSLNGTTLPIDEPFLSNGDQVDLEEGTFTYSYIPQYTAVAHPNDRCQIEVDLVNSKTNNAIKMSLEAHNYIKILYGGL